MLMNRVARRRISYAFPPADLRSKYASKVGIGDARIMIEILHFILRVERLHVLVATAQGRRG